MYQNVYICEVKEFIMREYIELKNTAEYNFKVSRTKGDQRFHFLVLLALESGARVSDLLNITIDNFSRENNITYLNYYNKKSDKHQTQRISDNTASKIEIVSGDSLSRYVFYNESKGAIMSRITANRKCTKIYGFNFHNLRKLAGKNVASQKGVVYASKFLGHSRVSTTDIYLGVSTEQFKKDMLDCII